MDFGVNTSPVEVIKEGAFGETYFRDIYTCCKGKWYRKSWKEFNVLKNINQKFYYSDYYDVNVNKYGVKCGPSLRLWKSKGCINKIDPYGWFQWYFTYSFGGGSKDDERQINSLEGIASGLRDKLVKMAAL